MKITEKPEPFEDVEVGGWKVSADYGVLSSPEGKSLVLEPRLAKLMYLLTQNANTLVSRNYLIQHIWPDTVVNDESLTRAIADLRKTLDMNFDNIKIDTIPKRGYQLALQSGSKTYALKLKIKRPWHYAMLGFILLLLTFLWFAGYLNIYVG